MAARPIHVARHVRIADDIRTRITSGKLEAGDRLPAESDLMAHHQVSRPTVREALAVLENEGLITRRHGIGNFVRPAVEPITYTLGDPLPDTLVATNGRLEVNATCEAVTADPDLAALMNVPPHTDLTQYTYLSRSMDQPLCLARVFVTSDLAGPAPAEVNASPWGDRMPARLATLGIHVANVATRVTARLPDPDEVWSLRIGASTPVLRIERVSRDTTGHTVEAALLTLPGHSADAVHTAHASHMPEPTPEAHDDV